MNYLIAPLHAHFDYGFGATGNAFKEAGDRQSEQEDAKNKLFNNQLHINYLYRPAIELLTKDSDADASKSAMKEISETTTNRAPSWRWRAAS